MVTGEWIVVFLLNSMLVAVLRVADPGAIVATLVAGYLTVALYFAGQEGAGAYATWGVRWMPTLVAGGWWWWVLAPG